MKKFLFIAVFVAVLVSSLSALRGFHFAMGAAAGSGFSILSLSLLYIIIHMAMKGRGPKGAKKSKFLIIFAALTKFALLGFVLWFLINRTSMEPLAFLLGLSTIALSAVCLAVVNGLKEN